MAQIYHLDGHTPTPSGTEHPFPVTIKGKDFLPPVAGACYKRALMVPGIGTASAYTAGDAFGTVMTFFDAFREGVNSGTIVKAVWVDRDDEGKQKDLVFYDRPVTTTNDNAAYAPNDPDILSVEGYLSITNYLDLANNQIGVWTGSFWVRSLDKNLYVRCVTQGADNIAANAEPYLILWIIPD